MWLIEFESEKFLPYLPEECQANPGVYGFELALWLSRELAGNGVITSYPLGEDWGWFIEYIQDEIEIMVGCSSQTGAGEGYCGKPITWGVFVKPRLSIKQRLKGKSPAGPMEHLIAAIRHALESEGIVLRDA
jgi:hypothetical protein